MIMLQVFGNNLEQRLDALDLAPQVRQELLAQRTSLAGIELPADISAEQQATLEGTINMAFVSSFRTIMLIASGLALLSALTAMLLIAGRPAVDQAAVVRGPAST
jgi:hypothetical protein